MGTSAAKVCEIYPEYGSANQNSYHTVSSSAYSVILLVYCDDKIRDRWFYVDKHMTFDRAHWARRTKDARFRFVCDGNPVIKRSTSNISTAM